MPIFFHLIFYIAVLSPVTTDPSLSSRNVSEYLTDSSLHVPWASCQIRKIAGCACAGNAGNVFPATAG